MKYRSISALIIAGFLFAGCSVSKQIKRKVNNDVLTNPAFTSAHTGISIFEPTTGKYWYNYQADKYFVPASNTKLATCFAAMKYLGDSLVGMRYTEDENNLFITPSGDPTFLHPDFAVHPVFDYLHNTRKAIIINTSTWQDERWGPGWSWDDYSDYYAAERSPMPVYGNVLHLSNQLYNLEVQPGYFRNDVSIENGLNKSLFPGSVQRQLAENIFTVTATRPSPYVTETPFFTGNELLQELLYDTLHKTVIVSNNEKNKKPVPIVLHSQPTDSMLKPLMHRSDNFYAEQTLLMVSDKLLGVMNDAKIIDTLLATDFKDLPQKPYWVDGSGLSHYNLFSPMDFVTILNKMKNEFGMDRIKNILATGGTGTISNYYKADSGFIYGKTGTLSGVVAFSGFLYTKKNKLLIFSTLVNNHHGNTTDIRKGIEKFIEEVRNKN